MESTQVAIVGGGPAGMLLSHMLHLDGIDSVVLERQPRDHVLKRIRAGVLEHGTVKLLRDVGLGERMEREGHAHDGTLDRMGKPRALPDRHQAAHRQADVVVRPDRDHRGALPGAGTRRRPRDRRCRAGCAARPDRRPALDQLREGRPDPEAGLRISSRAATAITGCRAHSIPSTLLRTFERAYPFGWLGVMSETPPLGDIMYAQHSRGFALASQRNAMLSRYYIQCDLATQAGGLAGRTVLGGAEAPLPARHRCAGSSPARRSKNRSRRCAASSPSR